MLNLVHKNWYVIKNKNNSVVVEVLTCEFPKDGTFSLEYPVA